MSKRIVEAYGREWVMSAPYDGDPNETIYAECDECGLTIETTRTYLKRPRIDRDDEYWSIRRGDNGEIIATCDGCQERDHADGPGERDV